MALHLSEASGGNFGLTKPGLAIGSTTSQLSTAAAATPVIDGVHQTSKAATASFVVTAATGYTLPNIPTGSKAAIGVWLDSAGNFKATLGVIAPVAKSTDKVAPPPFPGSMAPVGVATVYNNSGADFVIGTTAFNAAGVTTAYTDYATIVGTSIA